MGEPDPTCNALDGQGNTAEYRCVCGNMVSLDGDPATCLVCGREYASDVLRELNVETTLIDFDGARSPEREGRSPKSAEDNLIGRKLGHFEIIDRLGGGGMGTVYRALDVSLQRYVALKVLRHPSGASQSDVQRLFEEARARRASMIPTSPTFTLWEAIRRSRFWRWN